MYERGFVISKNNQIVLKNWKKVNTKTLIAWIHPMLNFFEFNDEKLSILLLGTVINPVDNIADGEEILNEMSIEFQHSEYSFFNYIDKLSGRFVLVVDSKSKTYILQDASGNKSLFYHSNFNLFSSHAELIADLSEESMYEESRRYIQDIKYQSTGHFPGLLTPYKNIFKCTPNTLIDLRQKNIRRFFPREPITTRKINNDLVDELSMLFQRQISQLSKSYKLSLSLTAGLDSRISLAASRNFKDDIYFYTIRLDKRHDNEIKYVKELCSLLDIQHNVLSDRGTIGIDFIDKYLKNTSYMSSVERGCLAKILYENYPKERLHIKSNVSEITRAYYYEYIQFLPRWPNAKYLARLYGYDYNSEFVIKAFQDFIDKTQFLKHRLFNYNPYDMYYWEYRMGSWQSLGLMECDVAQDSFILFNNRHILKLMLSVPLEDRKKKTLHYQLINAMWPQALSVKINPWVKKSKKQDVKKIIRGIYYRLGY